MPRNRIISQCEGLFTGPTGALPSGASLTGIQRVQTVTFNDNINRQTIRQFGKLAQIDRVIVDAPAVTLTFESLLVNAINSVRLGLVADGASNCIGNLLSGFTDVRNYYLAVAPDGSDLVGTTGAGGFGFGNGFLSNVSYQGAVGDTAKENFSIEALNLDSYTISSGIVPSVDPKTGLEPGLASFVFPVATTGTTTSVSALQPGDVTLALTDTLGFSTADLHIQNFNVSIPLAREDIKQLGTKFAFAKVITFPVTATASFDTIVGDIAASSLANKLCNDAPVELTINLKAPDCSGNGAIQFRINMKQCKLDSTSYSSNLDGNSTCTFTYSTLIGAGNDLTAGVFLSGVTS